MVSYNPKSWVRYIFNLHKADTVRKLFPWLILMTMYAFFITWLELSYFHLSEKHNLKNITILHTLLGFAISMLLVFRTNTAYDRWWEGRRQWGSLINCSRNLAAKLSAVLPENENNHRVFFSQIIPAFAFALKNHLQLEETKWAMDEKPHPEIPDFTKNGHAPSQIAAHIFSRLQLLYQQKIIVAEQLLYLTNEASLFLETCGACERIRNTPIPFSYSTFIKKFIFIYVLTLPLGLAFSLGYIAIPVVVLVFYVLGSLEVIAEEIEEPFGNDDNDLPMKRMCETIQRNVDELFFPQGTNNGE